MKKRERGNERLKAKEGNEIGRMDTKKKKIEKREKGKKKGGERRER